METSMSKLERSVVIDLHMEGSARSLRHYSKAKRREVLTSLVSNGYLSTNGAVTEKAINEISESILRRGNQGNIKSSKGGK